MKVGSVKDATFLSIFRAQSFISVTLYSNFSEFFSFKIYQFFGQSELLWDRLQILLLILNEFKRIN